MEILPTVISPADPACQVNAAHHRPLAVEICTHTNGTARDIETVHAVDGEFSLRIDGQPYATYFALNGAMWFVAHEGKTYRLSAATHGAARHDSAHTHSDEDAIRSPMPDKFAPFRQKQAMLSSAGKRC